MLQNSTWESEKLKWLHFVKLDTVQFVQNTASGAFNLGFFQIRAWGKVQKWSPRAVSAYW